MLSSNKIILTSYDGESFEVEKVVALGSQTLKHMLKDVGANDVVSLPLVSGKTLSKVIEYCKKHRESAKTEDLKSWDTEFVNVDHDTLFDLILAANYLDIKGLMSLACKTVSDMMQGKTAEEVRKIFNIKPDFTVEEAQKITSKNYNIKSGYTPEEEKKILSEQWGFEDE